MQAVVAEFLSLMFSDEYVFGFHFTRSVLEESGGEIRFSVLSSVNAIGPGTPPSLPTARSSILFFPGLGMADPRAP